MRSMHSSEKIEERVSELEGFRWDGDMNKLKYGRHVTNTFSWDLENSTTNTESELC